MFMIGTSLNTVQSECSSGNSWPKVFIKESFWLFIDVRYGLRVYRGTVQPECILGYSSAWVFIRLQFSMSVDHGSVQHECCKCTIEYFKIVLFIPMKWKWPNYFAECLQNRHWHSNSLLELNFIFFVVKCLMVVVYKNPAYIHFAGRSIQICVIVLGDFFAPKVVNVIFLLCLIVWYMQYKYSSNKLLL